MAICLSLHSLNLAYNCKRVSKHAFYIPSFATYVNQRMVMLPTFQQLLQAITMEEMEATNSLQPTLTSLKLYNVIVWITFITQKYIFTSEYL